MDDRITLYGSFTSSSTYKPMLFLALARLPFSFRTVNLKTGKQNEPEYLAVNRYGKVPALRHRGLTIVQSNVILDYLARVTGQFEGASEQDRWQAREWLSWEADAIQNIARVRHFSRFRAVDPAVMAHFRPLAEEALAFMDKSLEGRNWLVGEACTIADIGCWGRMVFMAEGGMDIARWPNVEAWSRRLAAMPGFALPYDLIPKKGPGDAAGLSGAVLRPRGRILRQGLGKRAQHGGGRGGGEQGPVGEAQAALQVRGGAAHAQDLAAADHARHGRRAQVAHRDLQRRHQDRGSAARCWRSRPWRRPAWRTRSRPARRRPGWRTPPAA